MKLDTPAAAIALLAFPFAAHAQSNRGQGSPDGTGNTAGITLVNDRGLKEIG